MRLIAGLIGLVAVLIAVLPPLDAQDKKDDPKVDKKDADKKDPEKKDAKKDDDDKGKKPKKEPEEKPVYGQTITAKIKRIDANSAREFAIEVPQIDPAKVYQIQMWQQTEMNRIMRMPPNQAQQRAQAMAQFQMQLQRKQSTEIYAMKDMELHAGDNCKVRAMSPPADFDDKGRPKIYTAKELTALKAGSKLPGYPVEFDHLAVGQVVTVYLAKPAAAPKVEGPLPKKKKNADDDDTTMMTKPEAVMIVVLQEAPLQR